MQRRDEGVDRTRTHRLTFTDSPPSMSVALSSTCSSSREDTCEERILKRPHGSSRSSVLWAGTVREDRQRRRAISP